MAEGKRPGCEIVPTEDTSRFQLRVWLPSPVGPRPARVRTDAVVAGCRCTAASYLSTSSNADILIHLGVRLDDVLKGTPRMVLLDKTGSEVPSMGKYVQRKEGACTLMAAWDDVKAYCVVDNYFDVMCSFRINWNPSASSGQEKLMDLGQDLAMMSDKQDLTDVSFDVGGESFNAHRLVLATRSPVFRAQLYGPMAESKMASITIEDMEASTFRSLLHYIYHGSLTHVGVEAVCSTTAQYQHLLVAADRYGVEELKKICEGKLSGQGITVDSVVSMLELAEDHNCPKLKARCFDFLADGDNFKMVAMCDEYIRLMQNFPHLLAEVRNRIKGWCSQESPIELGAMMGSMNSKLLIVASVSLIILFLVVPGISIYISHVAIK